MLSSEHSENVALSKTQKISVDAAESEARKDTREVDHLKVPVGDGRDPSSRPDKSSRTSSPVPRFEGYYYSTSAAPGEATPIAAIHISFFSLSFSLR